MSDETAKLARLMRVTDAVIQELERQGVTEVVANAGFDPLRMAKAVIRAADGDVVSFPGNLPEEKPLSVRRARPARCGLFSA